ncbi:hypothetical protein THICB2_50076 [Thiomonas sp. CB2]|nr:hypothetical protein THICB2_50076 [Thiomonas sp. CB2]
MAHDTSGLWDIKFEVFLFCYINSLIFSSYCICHTCLRCCPPTLLRGAAGWSDSSKSGLPISHRSLIVRCA